MAKNVTAPRRWRSSPDSPPTQLAYVTQPEIDLLVDANIHGSMKGKPNRGPNGIMSLDGDYVMSWSPPSQSSGGGGGGGGGPSHHAPSQPPDRNQGGPPSVLNPPPKVTAPVSTGMPNYGPPIIQNPPPKPPVKEVWGEEDIDYLGGELVSDIPGSHVGVPELTQAEINAAAAKKNRIKIANELSSAIGASGTTQKELEYMLSRGTMSTKLAKTLGKAVQKWDPNTQQYLWYDTATGKRFVPGEHGISADILTTAGGEAVEDWREGVLGDIQTAQDYGVYGGVAGIEAEMNKQKGSVDSQIKELQKKGLNLDQIKNELLKNPNFASLAKLHGYKGDIENIFDPTGTKAGSVGDWVMANTTQPEPGATGLGAVGYDPTGVHTWSDIESTEGEPGGLYEKYLGAGTNWDDPLSGIFAPEPTRQEDEGGSGYGYRNRYSQRDQNLALLRFLEGGSPIRKQRKSGFHHQGMEDPYAEPMRIAGEKGIFSGISGTGISGEAMKRLLKSWGSGYTNPRHANVAARGGIMSAWNDMRR